MRSQIHQNDQNNQYVSQYSQGHAQIQNQSTNYLPTNRGGVQTQNQNQPNMQTQYYNPYAYQAQTIPLSSQREGVDNFNTQMSHMTFNQSSDGTVRGVGNDSQYRMPGQIQGQGQGSSQQGQGQGVSNMNVRTVQNNTRQYVPNGAQVYQGQGQNQGQGQVQGQGHNYVPQQQQVQVQESYNIRGYVPRHNE